jgi:hypothetical protein
MSGPSIAAVSGGRGGRSAAAIVAAAVTDHVPALHRGGSWLRGLLLPHEPRLLPPPIPSCLFSLAGDPRQLDGAGDPRQPDGAGTDSEVADVFCGERDSIPIPPRTLKPPP